MKKLCVLFALLLIAGTCTAQPMMSWFTKAHGDTLGILTLNNKPNAWFSATKGWKYADAKTTALSGTSGDKVAYALARMDSLEAKLERTRKSLEKEVKRNKALTERVKTLEGK